MFSRSSTFISGKILTSHLGNGRSGRLFFLPFLHIITWRTTSYASSSSILLLLFFFFVFRSNYLSTLYSWCYFSSSFYLIFPHFSFQWSLNLLFLLALLFPLLSIPLLYLSFSFPLKLLLSIFIFFSSYSFSFYRILFSFFFSTSLSLSHLFILLNSTTFIAVSAFVWMQTGIVLTSPPLVKCLFVFFSFIVILVYCLLLTFICIALRFFMIVTRLHFF